VGKETAALLVITAVHVIAGAVLVWAVFDGGRLDWRGWWPRDDDPSDGPDEPDAPGGDGLPLPGAEPAGRRLRTEHERLPGRRRARRPAHAPQPDRTRDPA
jgi:hypothetical protein